MYPNAVLSLINQLSRLPGIGPKSAERLALYMVRANNHQVESLAKACILVKKEVQACSSCNNLADVDPCPICGNPQRDSSLLCVVESSAALAAMESAGTYKGKYFVLFGNLDPMQGLGPEEVLSQRFMRRLNDGQVKEVIIATNPTAEGEATADLIAKACEGFDLVVTRLGYGMPVGGDLKYMDKITLSRSLESRRKID